MPAIYLVRHGQTGGLAEGDPGITELGERQAEAAAAELQRRGLRMPVLITGALRRQLNTAAIISLVTGIKLSAPAEPGFNEFDHQAILSAHSEKRALGGRDNREVQAALDQALTAWIADAGGEWESFVAGAVGALDEVISRAGPGRDVVIVTSCGVIAALCMRAIAATPNSFVALNRMAVNASITVLVAGSSGKNLLSYNDHAHLLGRAEKLLTYR